MTCRTGRWGGSTTAAPTNGQPGSLATRAALGALLLAVTYCSAAWADWPTARGNVHRTGNNDGLPGPKDPSVLWVYKAQEHYVASPVPGPKAIYVGGLGAYNTGVFRALAAAPQAESRELWSKAAPFIKRPTVCAPALVEGLLVFGDGMHQTDDAVLYCLRAEDGLPVWQYPLPGKLVHLEAAPAVEGGRVFACGGDAGLLCVDLKKVKLDGKEQDIAATTALIAKRWAELLARYEEDKKKDPQLAIPPSEDALPRPEPNRLWQQGQGKWHSDAPPLVAGDFVLVASAYLDDDKVGKRCLACVNVADGTVAWETPLNINPWAGPTLADQLVLVGCSSIRFDRNLLGQARGEVVAVDLASGQVRWRENVPGGVLGPIAVQGDTAVYTATDGKVVARRCSNGQHLWTYDAKRPFFAGAAIAGRMVYVADLKAVVHALDLAAGKPQWTLDVAGHADVQARGAVFGSPIVCDGDLYLATCNLEGEADQPAVVVCLSDKKPGAATTAAPIAVDKQRRSVSIPCRIAPRKLPTLKEIYPLEVVATYPTPRGQKAHETVVTFECKPSEVHRALESIGLRPGKPARGEGATASGPEVRIYLELPGLTGVPRAIPIEKTMLDGRTGKPLPPIKWYFTGSVPRQPDPEKPDRVYGADLSGTLITLVPVTDETVCQTNLTMKEERLLKLETNKNVLPEEGTHVRLIIAAK